MLPIIHHPTGIPSRRITLFSENISPSIYRGEPSWVWKEGRRLRLQPHALCKLRSSVGPHQHFSVYQGGLCVRLVGGKTGNEDRALIAFVNSTSKTFNHQFESIHHPGGGRGRSRKSQTGNAMKGDESGSIKRETFGLKFGL